MYVCVYCGGGCQSGCWMCWEGPLTTLLKRGNMKKKIDKNNFFIQFFFVIVTDRLLIDLFD